MKNILQVILRRCEVCEVCRHLVEELGLDWDWADWQLVSGSIINFPLPVFLTFLEGRYARDCEPSALTASVDSVYKYFVGQVFFQVSGSQSLICDVEHIFQCHVIK